MILVVQDILWLIRDYYFITFIKNELRVWKFMVRILDNWDNCLFNFCTFHKNLTIELSL